MGNCVIFYSWQSDLPNGTNRSFIEKALENAVKAIHDDDSIRVEPVVDRDTVGVPGTPDIAATIMNKIEQAQIFVCDISIINQGGNTRPTPNPNVLIELGYAFRVLGPNKIIMVLNSAYGKPEMLPFDLRQRRLTLYNMPQDAEERTPMRKELEGKLEQGLRAIIATLEREEANEVASRQSALDLAMTAIERSSPNQTALVRHFVEEWVKKCDTIAPPFPDSEGKDEPDELILQSLNASKDLVLEYSRLVEYIAQMNASEAARTLYKAFSLVLDRYFPEHGFAGSYRTTRLEFYKFLAHELFVALFAFLIREERWSLIADLLAEGIYCDNLAYGSSGIIYFEYVSQTVNALEYRKERLHLQSLSLRADLLNERHTQGELGKHVPMRQFMDADFLLFLRCELEWDNKNDRRWWSPWSTLYLRDTPRYLVEAISEKYAKQLLKPLGVKDVVTLRERLVERNPIYSVRRLFGGYPSFGGIEGFDLSSIGTR